MLRPTYNDLIDSLRREDGDMQVAESRYSVVIASAKRAKQLIDGEDPLLPNEEGRKPLSIAIDEISHRVVGIERGPEEEEEPPVRQEENYAPPRYSSDDEEEYEDAEAEDEALSEDMDREDEEDEGDSPEDDYGSDDDM